MKIFIINKKYFEEIIGERSKSVHIGLYNQIMKSISNQEDIEHIFVNIDQKHEADAQFQFSHAWNNILFYNFISTVA